MAFAKKWWRRPRAVRKKRHKTADFFETAEKQLRKFSCRKLQKIASYKLQLVRPPNVEVPQLDLQLYLHLDDGLLAAAGGGGRGNRRRSERENPRPAHLRRVWLAYPSQISGATLEISAPLVHRQSAPLMLRRARVEAVNQLCIRSVDARVVRLVEHEQRDLLEPNVGVAQRGEKQLRRHHGHLVECVCTVPAPVTCPCPRAYRHVLHARSVVKGD